MPRSTDNLCQPTQNLRMTLWGVQGSCPIFPTRDDIQEYSRRLATLIASNPERIGLPELPLYGGETTCVEVETSDGDILLFDAGSGLRRCSADIAARWQNRADRVLHLFGSHEHLDHRSGLSFARFCYVGGNPYTIHVYGSQPFLRALDKHYGLFSKKASDVTYLDDPIDYTMMAARFQGVEIPADPQPIRIGNTLVQPFDVYHSKTRCLAYRIEHKGKAFVFCTDHELRHGPDEQDPRQQRSRAAEERLRAMSRDADVAYFDGQYYREEYLGKKGIGSAPPMPRLDWGHGCIEDILERTIACNIRHTLIGHHDPERPWAERAEIDQQLRQSCEGKDYRIQLADEGLVVET
ncbi:MAG: MBL fold metallo-hydrolase [Bacillota bacterium]